MAVGLVHARHGLAGNHAHDENRDLAGFSSGAADEHDPTDQFGGRFHGGFRQFDATTDDLNEPNSLAGPDESFGSQ